MSLMSNKNIVNLFYARAGPTHKVWMCYCGVSRIQNGTGFLYLLQHLERKHPVEPRSACNNSTPEQQKCFGKLLYWQKAISIYGWLSYVTYCLHPFTVVQDEDGLTRIRYEWVSLNTFKLYMSGLNSCVEVNILNCLTDHFALVFDGQTTSEAL